MSAPLNDLAIPKSILDTDLYKVSSTFWIGSWNSLCSPSFPCNRPFYAISQIFRQLIALQTVIVQRFSLVNASSVFKRLYPVCSILSIFCVILIDHLSTRLHQFVSDRNRIAMVEAYLPLSDANISCIPILISVQTRAGKDQIHTRHQR